MRKIFIKESTSENHKRKNLLITELIKRDGFSARAEKKYAYYVSEREMIPDPDKLKEWMETQNVTAKKKERHVTITKTYDCKKGTGEMVYRVIGSFYVVQNLHIFAVVFMHSIRFHLLTGKFPHTNLPL
jgi:hypothetical protein